MQEASTERLGGGVRGEEQGTKGEGQETRSEV